MVRKITSVVAGAALVLLLGAGLLTAQDQGTAESQTGTGRMTHHGHLMRGMSDQAFAKKAAAGGLAEVKLGQLAQDKGSSDTVKSFGKRMVDEHSKANDQLKDITSKQSITLPNDVSKKDQATYDRLSKLSGAAFDRAYARDMVKDHETDIAEFKREANNGKDPAIKGFASQTLPTLEDHLKQARQMYRNVAHSSTKGSASSSQ